jgi:catechol 2,3-dioxygenase-like lactoylglutathione lyase family enzyme
MQYRSVTHVALRVPDLRQAEEFYTALFGLQVAFREAEVADGWRTLPEGAGWQDAQAAGISLDLSVLHRDALSVALERAGEGFVPGGRLSHVGLEVADVELERLRQGRLLDSAATSSSSGRDCWCWTTPMVCGGS